MRTGKAGQELWRVWASYKTSTSSPYSSERPCHSLLEDAVPAGLWLFECCSKSPALPSTLPPAHGRTYTFSPQPTLCPNVNGMDSNPHADLLKGPTYDKTVVIHFSSTQVSAAQRSTARGAPTLALSVMLGRSYLCPKTCLCCCSVAWRPARPFARPMAN